MKIRLPSTQNPRCRIALLWACVFALLSWGYFCGSGAYETGRTVIKHAFIQNATAPVLTLTSKPAVAEGRLVRVSYDASDEYGITEIALRVTPRDPLPGATNAPVNISLPAPLSKRITRTDFQDVGYYPWAGQTITVQLVATNELGKKSNSESVELTLPERRFLNPVAQALVAERKKLLQNPDSDALREEAANLMAGFAQQTAGYSGDQVVFMALRSGAVRLVLGREKDAILSVNDLLWQIATRLEENNPKAVHRSARNSNGT